MSISDSEFIEQSPFLLSDGYTDIHLLHESTKGHTRIFRSRKGVKFFILKCLREKFKNEAFYQELLRKEFDIGYTLDSPYLVHTYSYEPVENLGQCIVLEWIDGITLDEYIKTHEIDEKEAIRLIEEICKGTSYLHNRQIKHGDLKPSNILITNDGNHAKIIDFGFSDSASYASLRFKGGTPGYSSPEQTGKIDEKADSRADTYSIGRIMQSLYPDNQSKEYRRVMEKCCKINPHQRPKSVNEIVPMIKNERNKRILKLRLISFLIICSFIGLTIAFGTLGEEKESINNPHEIVDGEDDLTSKTMKTSDIESNNSNFYILPADASSQAPTNSIDFGDTSSSDENEEKIEGEPMLVLTSTMLDYNIHKILDSEDETAKKNWKARAREETIEWVKEHVPDRDDLHFQCILLIDTELESYEN